MTLKGMTHARTHPKVFSHRCKRGFSVQNWPGLIFVTSFLSDGLP